MNESRIPVKCGTVRGIVARQTRVKPHIHRRIGTEGVDFVRCRICGDHHRVISGRHLSKHGIDRLAYMDDYHLSPDQLIAKDFRTLRSSRPGFQPYGKSDWIAAIRRIYRTDGNVSPKYLQAKHRHIYNQARWIFGDFNKALQAAGLDPSKMRARVVWDNDRIIAAIRRLRQQKQPLYAHYANTNHTKLFASALTHYRSWPNALAAALPKSLVPANLLTPIQILRALRDASGDVRHSLRLQAEFYFGSLSKARAAVRKDPRMRSGWSSEKILTVLRRMHRDRKGLGYGDARRQATRLVTAAEAYFGSLGRALDAAGIDPNLYFVHHKWRKSRVNHA